jgi:hypothetical protein
MPRDRLAHHCDESTRADVMLSQRSVCAGRTRQSGCFCTAIQQCLCCASQLTAVLPAGSTRSCRSSLRVVQRRTVRLPSSSSSSSRSEDRFDMAAEQVQLVSCIQCAVDVCAAPGHSGERTHEHAASPRSSFGQNPTAPHPHLLEPTHAPAGRGPAALRYTAPTPRVTPPATASGSQFGCYTAGTPPVFRANDRLIGHHLIHPPSAGFGRLSTRRL